MRNRNTSNMILFLLGLFSETQIRFVGSLGIAELFIFIAAPIVFMLDYYDLKRNGFIPLLMLALLSCVGCIISSVHNGTPMQAFLRGFASAYSLFAIPVVVHHFLWRNLSGFKWLLVGCAISAIVTIFVFTSAAEMAIANRTSGDVATADLYYMIHFGPLTALPMNAFYMNVPVIFGVICYSLPTIYTVFTKSTGRSALMGLFLTTIMVFSAGHKVSRMKYLKKHMVVFLLIASVVAAGSASVYKYFAVSGFLTNEAREKYENQTKTGKGLLGLIMGGRSEFFVGLMAAIDQPIYGHGPWPLDHNGYYENFISKYGDYSDYLKYREWQRYLANTYGIYRVGVIPCHSMIVGNWLFYGILGFPFWFYILFKIFTLLRKHIDTVPQWFGYFACMVAQMFWSIFFSGYGARMSTCVFITAMLLAIAAGDGRIRLPIGMFREIEGAMVRGRR